LKKIQSKKKTMQIAQQGFGGRERITPDFNAFGGIRELLHTGRQFELVLIRSPIMS
jgi:hypothetical protein